MSSWILTTRTLQGHTHGTIGSFNLIVELL